MPCHRTGYDGYNLHTPSIHIRERDKNEIFRNMKAECNNKYVEGITFTATGTVTPRNKF